MTAITRVPIRGHMIVLRSIYLGLVSFTKQYTYMLILISSSFSNWFRISE